MDSAGLYLAVKNFTNLTPEEGSEIGELSKQYPYSQLFHLLYARSSKDLNSSNQLELLNRSAVYSTDRAVLKWVITDPKKERIQAVVMPVTTTLAVERIEKPEIIEQEIEHSVITPVLNVEQQKVVTPVAKIVHDDHGISLTDDALRNDIYHELEKLQKLKHEFSISFDEYQKASQNDKKSKPLKESTGEPLLDELKSTKKKLKIDNPKQKEQNDIIDQFIKTQPVISKSKPLAESNDLAEDSSMFSDNIVSETLVSILLKQGKKEKAIEVLKKLIWKFPQKKAYFAAQIEDLKN